MTTKSPEEIGAQCCRKIAKQGAHAGPEIIAAAIREDRAEMEADLVSWRGECDDWREAAAQSERELTSERQRREEGEAVLKALVDFTDSTGEPQDCPYCHDPMAWSGEPKKHEPDCVFEKTRAHVRKYQL